MHIPQLSMVVIYNMYIYICFTPLAGDHSFADHLLCSIGRGVVWLQKKSMVNQSLKLKDSVNRLNHNRNY